MTYETLDVRTDDRGVAYVTLNMPDKRKRAGAAMIAELTDMALTTGASRETRAIVLAGSGKVFCAGGDLAWMKLQIAADRVGRMREARKLAEMLNALNEMPTPMIARVHGGAFGGGVGMACVADVAVAAEYGEVWPDGNAPRPDPGHYRPLMCWRAWGGGTRGACSCLRGYLARRRPLIWASSPRLLRKLTLMRRWRRR